ncbi:hypothetical protein MASR2M15_10100 [Anaerolineales bacterium]
MSEQQNPPRRLQVQMPANPSASYANTVMISHTAAEIILDFIQIMPNDPRARVQQRIVMTPTHTKLFLNALMDNINKYEEQHGEIVLPKRPHSLADQLFNSIKVEGSEEDEGDDGDDSN